MSIDDRIRDEKLQWDINGEATKIKRTIKDAIPEDPLIEEAKNEI